MKKLILHIPHSSTIIPSLQGYVVEKDILNAEMAKLTDWYTHELFSNPTDVSVVASFSRIFCDPERFTDDSQQVMAKFGMGVLYETLDDGDKMHEVTSLNRAFILENFYDPHHKKLNSSVIEQLQLNEKVLVADCHSFPFSPFTKSVSARYEHTRLQYWHRCISYASKIN